MRRLTPLVMREVMVAAIHLADAARAGLKCRVRPKNEPKNWTWIPEQATCTNCLRIYNRGVKLKKAVLESLGVKTA